MERHIPVLLQESLRALAIKENDTVLDATVGTGGHAQHIVAMIKTGTFVGIDTDGNAIDMAREKLNHAPKTLTVHLQRKNFKDIADVSHDLGISAYNAVFADLGWGSHQLTGKGLSFSNDEPLDMCYGKNCSLNAMEIVNTFTEKELAALLHNYGEERWADRIASFIIEKRKEQPITTTAQLAETVSRAVPRKLQPRSRNVATKTFQAIRIVVNDELNALEQFLKEIRNLTAPKATLAIIAFHSLEDRIVKKTFRTWEQDGFGKHLIKKQ